MTGFDLRALVRDVCDTSTSADPVVVMTEVRRRIAQADQGAALEQALLTFVRHMISQRRVLTLGGHQGFETQRFDAPGGHPSWKVTGIRNAWRATLLRQRLSVGEAPTAWKFFGDCTGNDLTYAADVRDQLAVSNALQAQRLRDLAKLLAEHGVTTVKELPDDVLGSALGDAA